MIYIILVAVVILFTISIGIILTSRDNNVVSDEKMTDDVSVLFEEKDNAMDEEII